ncbi:phytase [Nannocystaceae bacterium ST9]
MTRLRSVALAGPSLGLLLGACSPAEGSSDEPPTFSVEARAETEPSMGDPDDVAVWRNPLDPARSLIVATDKSGGIQLYDLEGRLIQDRRDGVMNNVDLRADVPLGDPLGVTTLIATSNRTSDSLDLYAIDGEARELTPLASVPSEISEPYGLCMFRSPIDAAVYVFANSKDGTIGQYRVEADAQLGMPTLVSVRTLHVEGQPEGCVADDELGRLYVGEEDRGIWRFSAEPGDDELGTLIADVESGPLVADVEGLAIYRAAAGAGYLIASSQGDNAYAVFERAGDNAYLTRFRIASGMLDAANESDGIEVVNFALGPDWPAGLFIAHDDHNEEFSRNFKLVSWADVASAADVELLVDPDHQ